MGKDLEVKCLILKSIALIPSYSWGWDHALKIFVGRQLAQDVKTRGSTAIQDDVSRDNMSSLTSWLGLFSSLGGAFSLYFSLLYISFMFPWAHLVRTWGFLSKYPSRSPKLARKKDIMGSFVLHHPVNSPQCHWKREVSEVRTGWLTCLCLKALMPTILTLLM